MRGSLGALQRSAKTQLSRIISQFLARRVDGERAIHWEESAGRQRRPRSTNDCDVPNRRSASRRLVGIRLYQFRQFRDLLF
jgi:hypothetical protein